jgi:hypothetical protein
VAAAARALASALACASLASAGVFLNPTIADVDTPADLERLRGGRIGARASGGLRDQTGGGLRDQTGGGLRDDSGGGLCDDSGGGLRG